MMNKRAANMYRNFSLLFSNGIACDDIFEMLGISKVYIFGIGEMGQIFLSYISATRIKGVLDKTINNSGTLTIDNQTFASCTIADIKNDDIPIIITPSAGYKDIFEELVKNRISVKRILSLNLLLRYGILYLDTLKERSYSPIKKEFMIVGANYENKGSQAMSFVVVDEIRKKYGAECVIWCCPNYKNYLYSVKRYRIFFTDDGWDYDSLYFELMPRLTAVFDISGYTISSINNFGNTDRVLSQLNIAKYCNIPFYLLPQSFGPLDFPEEKLSLMKELLSYARIIYARENDGKLLLEHKLGLKNVVLSNDIVLQNTHKNYDFIYTEKSNDNATTLKGIAIIPNNNLQRYLGEEKTVQLYWLIIESLLSHKEQITIIPHSNDTDLCRNIFNLFCNNPNVSLLEKYDDCDFFEHMISGCKYLIASRYHAIVHAYRRSVPCIVIGWAKKYSELTDIFNQTEYLLDIGSTTDYSPVFSSVELMEQNYSSESYKIRQQLKTVQNNNCFKYIWDTLESYTGGDVNSMNLAIFGAQGYALGAYEALHSLFPQRKITCFIVSERNNNAFTLRGIPVHEIESYSASLTENKKTNIEVLIATPENIQSEIELILDSYGFTHHKKLDSDRWAELMKLHYVKQGDFLPLSALPVGVRKTPIQIFIACSDKDKSLLQPSILPDYYSTIHVGPDNTSKLRADYYDNTGDNISSKNPNYSELSGLYWIWKNILQKPEDSSVHNKQYFGLGHYRRTLIFSEDDIYRLQDNDVDVVLPYPMPYEPDINAHHNRYLKKADWDALMIALKELQPEYADCITDILSQKYMYNYNNILAEKTVLCEYCEWLFPILERTEQLSVPKSFDRADRYIGYIAESLETLYFLKNSARLNIVHTECKLFT